MDSPLYHPLYLQGIAYFNDCEYFEAHEVWEDLWAEDHSTSRQFYKGLIQVAVALHHFGNENIRGARKLYNSSRKYLSEYLPGHHGLDLERFLSEFDACFEEVIASQEEFPRVVINPELIPEIQLNPPPVETST